MVNWGEITGFQWDQGNSRKSVAQHGVGQSEVEQIFFNQPLLLLVDEKHSSNEARYHALGVTDDGRLLHCTFTLRNTSTLIRVISVREMHRKERLIYEQQQLKPSTKTISLRLPETLLDRIKIEANRRDMPYQSLIKAWLMEDVKR